MVVVETGGDSAPSDIASGGASYFFTRIKKSTNANGIYYKPSVLLRQDVISYQGDMMSQHLSGLSSRKSTIAGMKEAATGPRNETIFKEGLGLDDIEFVGVRPSEVDQVVKAFKDKGITALPDERKIEDIVVTSKPPKSKRRFR